MIWTMFLQTKNTVFLSICFLFFTRKDQGLCMNRSWFVPIALFADFVYHSRIECSMDGSVPGLSTVHYQHIFCNFVCPQALHRAEQIES